ncbi:hypothetical protein M422DRAFT_782440, partial [Sphaerobolus stellatus SS14]
MFFSPIQDLQRPTHPRLCIRDARDAEIVLEAVKYGVLQRVQRRLNEGERSMFIRSGAIFVWEESDDENGIKRWTDGRTWTQSRAKEPFLFYEERIAEGTQTKVAGSYRFVDSSTQSPSRPKATVYSPRTPGNPSALVKQAYSAWIIDPKTLTKKKWHITAYFTRAELADLPS